MGKASRRRKEKRDMPIEQKKILKQLLRESSPEVFGMKQNGKPKVTYYNPLKKLLKLEPYKTAEGAAVTEEMMKKYKEFLNTAKNIEEIKKIKEKEDETKM